MTRILCVLFCICNILSRNSSTVPNFPVCQILILLGDVLTKLLFWSYLSRCLLKTHELHGRLAKRKLRFIWSFLWLYMKANIHYWALTLIRSFPSLSKQYYYRYSRTKNQLPLAFISGKLATFLNILSRQLFRTRRVDIVCTKNQSKQPTNGYKLTNFMKCSFSPCAFLFYFLSTFFVSTSTF